MLKFVVKPEEVMLKTDDSKTEKYRKTKNGSRGNEYMGARNLAVQ